MGEIIDGRSARIKADLVIGDGLKFLDAACKRIEYVHHIRILYHISHRIRLLQSIAVDELKRLVFQRL